MRIISLVSVLGFTFTAAIVVACSSEGAEESTGAASDPLKKVDGGYVVGPTKPGCRYDYGVYTCHDFAIDSVDSGDTDGILDCQGDQRPEDGGVPLPYYGHTGNWTVPEPGLICYSEPQRPGQGPAQLQCSGATQESCLAVSGCSWTHSRGATPGRCSGTPSSAAGGGTCCFSGKTNADGTPDPTVLDSAEAKACAKWLCGKQYDESHPPIPRPRGWTLDKSYRNCAATHMDDPPRCAACCDENASVIPDTWGPKATEDRERARAACKASCGDTGGGNTGSAGCAGAKTQSQCLGIFPPDRGGKSCSWVGTATSGNCQ